MLNNREDFNVEWIMLKEIFRSYKDLRTISLNFPQQEKHLT